MIKLMSVISCALIIAILAVVVFKMVGQGDVVDAVGSQVVYKLGLVDGGESGNIKNRKTRNEASKLKETDVEFAEEVLGWNINDIENKPRAIVMDGITRLNKIIEDLQNQRRKVSVNTNEARFSHEAAEEEIMFLKTAIQEGKAHLTDLNATYPVVIQNATYANKGQLQVALERSMHRYQELKANTPMPENIVAYGNAELAKIDERLYLAYELLEKLNSRFELAGIEEITKRREEIDAELSLVRARGETITNQEKDAGTGKAFDPKKSREQMREDYINSFIF